MLIDIMMETLIFFIGQMDDLKVKLKNLENELHHLQTRNQVLDGEVQTLRVQLEAKEKALEDALTEADLASSRLNNTDAMDRKQERIQKLQYEVSVTRGEDQRVGGGVIMKL